MSFLTSSSIAIPYTGHFSPLKGSLLTALTKAGVRPPARAIRKPFCFSGLALALNLVSFGKSVALRRRYREEGQDCPDRKKTMEELKDRYEIIEEAATDAIVTIDEQGKILSISRAAERIFGYSVPEMVGQLIDRIIPDYKQHVDKVRLKGKKAPVVEVSGTHKSGKHVQVELS